MIQINNFKLSQNDQFLFEIQKLIINNNSQVIALIGNNGTGKSSFAKSLAGLENKYEGTLFNTFKTHYVEQTFFSRNNSMSSGEFTKSKIIEAFENNSNLLILDEPSVNLDRNALNFLIKQIYKFKGVILLITHDRNLIEKTADEILEIEDNELKYYKTSFSNFIFEKENLQKQHNINLTKYNKTKKQLEKNIQMRMIHNQKHENGPKNLSPSELKMKGSPGKSSMSKSLNNFKNKLNNLEEVNKKYQHNKKIYFEFAPGLKKNQILYLPKYDFMINTNNKIGLIGSNGVGKTTLINYIYKQLLALNNPLIFLGYLPQTLPDEFSELKVKQFVELKAYETRNKIRSYLSQFKYTDLMYFKKIKQLSEGEKVQLYLSILLSVSSNILLLDEPTNYLDLNSIKMLEQAILEYKGTVIIVSHDAKFIDNVCDKTLNLDLYKDK